MNRKEIELASDDDLYCLGCKLFFESSLYPGAMIFHVSDLGNAFPKSQERKLDSYEANRIGTPDSPRTAVNEQQLVGDDTSVDATFACFSTPTRPTSSSEIVLFYPET